MNLFQLRNCLVLLAVLIPAILIFRCRRRRKLYMIRYNDALELLPYAQDLCAELEEFKKRDTQMRRIRNIPAELLPHIIRAMWEDLEGEEQYLSPSLCDGEDDRTDWLRFFWSKQNRALEDSIPALLAAIFENSCMLREQSKAKRTGSGEGGF